MGFEFEFGYDIEEHFLYPRRYYVTQHGKPLPAVIRTGHPGRRRDTKRLTLRQAQRLVADLIVQEQRASVDS